MGKVSIGRRAEGAGIARRGTLVLAVAAAGAVPAVLAQEVPPGGRGLTFGIEQRFESTENLDLDVNSQGRTDQATTRLSFGARWTTRTSSFGLTAGTSLRAADSPDASINDFALDNNRIGLDYTRRGATARFGVTASVQESDIAFLRPLEDFVTEEGVIELPEDLEDLNGTGSRRNTRVGTTLDIGEGGPWGLGLSASYSDISYSDVTSSGLLDSQRWQVGASLRYALNPATQLTVGLGYGEFRDDDPATDTRETISLSSGLRFARPNGAATVSLGAQDTEDGTRLNLTFGRSLTLPTGSLSTSLGLARSADGDASLSGSLSWQQQVTPVDRIDARFQRSIVGGTDDTDRLVTALSVGYRHELTPVSGLGLDVAWTESETTSTGSTVTNASVAASYNHALTEDWGLSAGYRYRLRDEDGVGDADSNSVFLVLRRNFSIGF